MQVYDTQQKIVDILQRPKCGCWELNAVGVLVVNLSTKLWSFVKLLEIREGKLSGKLLQEFLAFPRIFKFSITLKLFMNV